jgi:multidrug efflux pump subunit AcrA (membrane-fusion protein)
MFLEATVVGRVILKADSLIEVPSSALTMIEDKPAVWVVDGKDQRVQRRRIAVARYAPDSVIVTDGLRSGDTVVTAGVQELHEGQAVKLLAAQ